MLDWKLVYKQSKKNTLGYMYKIFKRKFWGDLTSYLQKRIPYSSKLFNLRRAFEKKIFRNFNL